VPAADVKPVLGPGQRDVEQAAVFRRLGFGGPVARALMCDVPIGATTWDGYATRRYDFDFRPCATGLRGYRWVFPCVIGGVPHANVGVYALPPVDGVRMRRELDETLAGVAAPPCGAGWRAFPIRTYDAGTVVGAPHALLVGDAAGVDPLMGEGISFALEYGVFAADAILRGRAHEDLGVGAYVRAVTEGALGRKLRRLALATRLFYGPRRRLWFRVAGASRRAQTIGLAWYNGQGGWDRRGPAAALAALVGLRPL